ncbi:MAG: hypothetical protein Q8940_07400 [Bacteroidota bacterium]|nr:hypothetical protein [Bacteroidota bacterium]
MLRNKNNESSCEKLRDEVFKINVDYHTWMRSLKVIGICVTIILTLLTFFGYDKIDSIEKTILERANVRLAKTDSLLAKIDDKRINEINYKLLQKEKEYEVTIGNFEKMIAQNERLEERILQLLPDNKRIDVKLNSYISKSPEDIFEIRPVKDSWNNNENMKLYLIFNDKYDLNKVIGLKFSIDNSKYEIKDYYYQIEQRFNKISVTLDLAKGPYLINFGFLEKSKDIPTYYHISKKINIR